MKDANERKSWGDQLRLLRERRGLTRAALAAQVAPCSERTIRALESGARSPGSQLLVRLCEALPELEPPDAGRSDPEGLVHVEDPPSALVPSSAAEGDLAEAMARCEELALQAQRLEQQATQDVLTGVKNRRAFDTALPRAIAAAHRRGEPLALVLLDIDGFKPMNDQYGHDTGDEVLKAFAPAMAAIVRERERDEFCRLGGDEFVALLENCGLQQARLIAERMRLRAAEMMVSGLRLSISVGVSSYHAPRAAIDDESINALGVRLVKEADQALYAAKEAGRNRVVAFDGALLAKRQAAADRRPSLRRPLHRLRSMSRIAAMAMATALLLSSGSSERSGKGCGSGGETTSECPPGTIRSNGQCISPEPPSCAGNECTDR